MVQLSVASAFDYVKRVLDELVSTEEIGMITDCDSIDLHKLVEGAMVEAVVSTHSASPSVLLDGNIARETDDYETERGEDGVVTITMKVPTLRMASFKLSDSNIIVTDVVPEDSPEGRMQLNEFVRGEKDDPVIVLQKVWKGENLPVFKYYSTDAVKKDVLTSELEFIPYPELVEGVVEISPRLRYPTLDMLTSIVLGYLSESDKAGFYREKAIKTMGV